MGKLSDITVMVDVDKLSAVLPKTAEFKDKSYEEWIKVIITNFIRSAELQARIRKRSEEIASLELIDSDVAK